MICAGILVLAGAVGGCKKSSDGPADAGLGIFPRTVRCPFDGSETSVRIVSEYEWTISGGDSWCRLERSSGSGTAVVGVKADPYAGTGERRARFTVSGSRGELDFDVVQAADGFAVEFDDAAFENLCLEYYDQDGDGTVTAAEASAAEWMELIHVSGIPVIGSLGGLEYFTGLQSLVCTGHPVTALDISSMRGLQTLRCNKTNITVLDVSANTGLTELYCSDNPIKALDVSALGKLRSLGCAGTRITTLDVSANTALRDLHCGGGMVQNGTEWSDVEGALKELILGRNSSLIEVYCESNVLTTLDVSGCTSLERLDCSKNKLTRVDISANTALKWVDCSDNDITALDVRANRSLVSLTCCRNRITALDVTANTELLYLVCGANAVSSLDVTKNARLRDLDIALTGLTSIDLRANPELEKLTCDGSSLASLDLSGNPRLYTLSCTDNNLGSLDLSSNPNLHYIACGGNPFTTLDLNANTELTYIDINSSLLAALDISMCPRVTTLVSAKAANLRTIYVWPGFSAAEMKAFSKPAAASYVER